MDGPPPPPPGPPLPNPVVYLNYLDPRGAFYYEVARNVYLATLGASYLLIIIICECCWLMTCFIGLHLGHSVLSPARLEAAAHQQATTCIFCLSSLEVGSRALNL